MNIFRLTCFAMLLTGIVVAAEALLPKSVYLVVFVACGIAALWVIATLDVGEKSENQECVPKSPHDVWQGTCYRCGDFVKKSELVRMSNGSRPDKHFHSWCWNEPSIKSLHAIKA